MSKTCYLQINSPIIGEAVFALNESKEACLETLTSVLNAKDHFMHIKTADRIIIFPHDILQSSYITIQDQDESSEREVSEDGKIITMFKNDDE